MRLVIDSNCLSDPLLDSYLRSTLRFAVLTDYLMMEAYKHDALDSIVKSMAILSAYASRVLILKPTPTVVRLSGRPAGLTRRMIEPNSEAVFRAFCDDLKGASDLPIANRIAT